MESTQQLIDNNGLQIPLPFMAQYGLHPGSVVTVELHNNEIRIVPKLPDRAAIEQAALKSLLKSLGDAILVKAVQLGDDQDDRVAGTWRVAIHAHAVDESLGYIDYAKNGELLSDLDTVLDDVRKNAMTFAPAT